MPATGVACGANAAGERNVLSQDRTGKEGLYIFGPFKARALWNQGENSEGFN